MPSIEVLQAEYDRLSAVRAQVIRDYDQAPDGSLAKLMAVRQLDNLGTQIREVEDEINHLLDKDEV